MRGPEGRERLGRRPVILMCASRSGTRELAPQIRSTIRLPEDLRYSPRNGEKSGGRFSLKAAMPSRASSDSVNMVSVV